MTGELSPLPAALQFQHMVSTRSRTPFHRFLSTLLLLSLLASSIALFALPSRAEAGSQTYDTPGTYTFTVPAHASLTVELWGGGGGGAGMNNSWIVANGSPGGASMWDAGAANGKPQANGGGGGTVIDYVTTCGEGGTGVNGDVNMTGETACNGGTDNSGGDGANGGAGPPPQTAYWTDGFHGTAPGGGGSGIVWDYGWTPGGGGGGYTSKTYSSGVYTPGASVSVVVGALGAKGDSNRDGGNGAPGRVEITWTDAPSGPDAPTNLITTSVSGGVSLSWTAPASSGGSNLETYGIWRASSPFSATTSATLIASIATTSTSYSDTSAVHGTVYYYRLTATNGTATSSLSNQKASGSNSGRIIRLRGAVRMLGGVRLH